MAFALVYLRLPSHQAQSHEGPHSHTWMERLSSGQTPEDGHPSCMPPVVHTPCNNSSTPRTIRPGRGRTQDIRIQGSRGNRRDYSIIFISISFNNRMGTAGVTHTCVPPPSFSTRVWVRLRQKGQSIHWGPPPSWVRGTTPGTGCGCGCSILVGG